MRTRENLLLSSKTRRALVSGGRHYGMTRNPKAGTVEIINHAQRLLVFTTLDEQRASRGLDLLIHGACIYGGADLCAEEWAKSRGVPYIGVPAIIDPNGYIRGHERNGWMLTFEPSLFVRFPGGRGTASMASWVADYNRSALAAVRPLIEVIEVEP